MDAVIRTAYAAYGQEHPQVPAVQRIEAFLCLGLDFAGYPGYELTCLADSMNFSACVRGRRSISDADRFRGSSGAAGDLALFKWDI